MIREPDSNFDPPEDPPEETAKCAECGKMSDSWTYIEHFGIVCYDCQDSEPDDDLEPLEDRDCDYWNR